MIKTVPLPTIQAQPLPTIGAKNTYLIEIKVHEDDWFGPSASMVHFKCILSNAEDT